MFWCRIYPARWFSFPGIILMVTGIDATRPPTFNPGNDEVWAFSVPPVKLYNTILNLVFLAFVCQQQVGIPLHQEAIGPA